MVASLFLLGAFTPLVLGRAYPAFYARDLNSSVVLGSSGFVSSSGAVLSSTSDSTSAPSSTHLSTSVFSSSSDFGPSISSTVSFSSTGLGITVNSSTTTGFSSSLTSSITLTTSSAVSPSSTASVESSVASSSSSSETLSSSGSVSSATAVPSTGFTTSLPANGSVTTTSLSSGVQSTLSSTESSSDASAAVSSSSSETASSSSSLSSSSSSSTTGAAILTTSTDSPGTTSTLTSASTQVITSIEGSKVTTNTHISTTGSNGQQTIIPILFGCSFCGGGGIELFGFGPGPGVFEWPPLPAFSSLPPITIDSSDNPSVEETSTPSSTQTTASSTSGSSSSTLSSLSSSSSSSSSASSCSSSTTTEEYVTCYAATTSGLTTTSASCSTVTSTITGCDLTATATTTTATATATCWQYNGWTTAETADDPDDSSDDDSDTSSKRSIAEQNEDVPEAPVARSLFKRAANEYSVFGTCKISRAVSSPSYPKKSAFNKNEKNAKKQNAAIRDQYWWEVVVDGTTCPGLAKLERNTEEISGTRLDRVNMDHVYEQSLPSDFLSYLFSDASSDICNAFERVFANTNDGNYPPTYKIQGTNPGRADQSRLQTVFNFLPNNDNLALMGMDKILNEKKGKLFNDKATGLQYATADSDSTQGNLELWNQVGMLFEFMNTDVTQRVFSSVQSSMYAAWVRYDEIWASEACDQSPLNFAQKYKDFVSTRISTNAESAQAWATAVSETAVKYATTTDEDGNPNSYASVIDNLQASYAPEKLTWSTDPWLQFPQSTANIKRQAAACTISATTTTTTSGTSASTTNVSTASASSSSASASVPTSSASNSTSLSITSSASSSESSSESSSVTSSASSSVATACSFVATVYPSSLQSIAGTGTQRYCQCGPTIAGINLATSGTSTTSYCALGSSAPSGFSQIPASNGVAISTSTSSTTIPSTASTTTTASATPSCDSMITTSLDKLFEFFGKGWDGSILGNGAGLENSLSDCSGNQVQDWGFYYKTDDTPIYDGDVVTDFDFKANGTMKGIDECFAKAALEQGGCLVGGSKVLPTG